MRPIQKPEKILLFAISAFTLGRKLQHTIWISLYHHPLTMHTPLHSLKIFTTWLTPNQSPKSKDQSNQIKFIQKVYN